MRGLQLFKGVVHESAAKAVKLEDEKGKIKGGLKNPSSFGRFVAQQKH